MPFDVRATDVAEEADGIPAAIAGENALRKALAAAGREGEIVLGVDTLVAAGGEVWGKPPDELAARRTLRRLAGREHVVVSGVALVTAQEVLHAFAATTKVTFRDVPDELLDWYVATGEWQGRAGGYAIQGRGSALVRRIDGDYLNVVGLPLSALLDVWPELLHVGD